MHLKTVKVIVLITALLSARYVFAWEGMPMPKLHVDGRYLKDNSGHIVNLHGFAQTYSPWFNEQNTKWTDYDVNGCLSYNKGIIDKILGAGWKINFVRMHMDPYWSNTPGCTGRMEGEECFNEERFKKYLDDVFVPMAEYAISKGLYVVMRPPGVCPEHIEIGGVYHKYLIKVWGIVSRHPKLKNHPNIMFELANEPIDILGPDGTYGAGTQGHFDNLKKYFQTITDTIRVSADNILWVPGLGYQSLYSGFSLNPIEGDNIGYAVHVYPGWFNSGHGYDAFQSGWDNQVRPVADFAPVMVTEMDWAPEKYNKSWGKDITGIAGGEGFGANFKKITDECGNVSWLIFTGQELLAQFGNPAAPADVKDFLTDPEACPWPVYHWYEQYAADYNFTGASDEYFAISQLIAESGDNIQVLTSSSQSLNIKAVFADGHNEYVGEKAEITVSNPEIVKVVRGRIFALKDGHADVKVVYTDTKGTKKELTIHVTSSAFPFTNKLFNPDIWENGTFDESTRALKTGPWGFGGWQYNGMDMSGFKFLVARLAGNNTADISFNLYDGSSYWGSPVATPFGNNREVVVPLKYVFKNDGTPFNSKQVYIAGFWSNGSGSFVIDTVFLTNSDVYNKPVLMVKDSKGNELTKMDGLSYNENSGPSATKSFIVLGDMLNGVIQIEPPAGFEISLSANSDFSSTLIIDPQNSKVSDTEIFIRLKANLQRNSYTGSLKLTSLDAQTKIIALTGKVEFPLGIKDISHTSEIIAREFYSITGTKIQNIDNWKGVYVEKNILSDGSIKSVKKIKE